MKWPNVILFTAAVAELPAAQKCSIGVSTLHSLVKGVGFTICISLDPFVTPLSNWSEDASSHFLWSFHILTTSLASEARLWDLSFCRPTSASMSHSAPNETLSDIDWLDMKFHVTCPDYCTRHACAPYWDLFQTTVVWQTFPLRMPSRSFRYWCPNIRLLTPMLIKEKGWCGWEWGVIKSNNFCFINWNKIKLTSVILEACLNGGFLFFGFF